MMRIRIINGDRINAHRDPIKAFRINPYEGQRTKRIYIAYVCHWYCMFCALHL